MRRSTHNSMLLLGLLGAVASLGGMDDRLQPESRDAGEPDPAKETFTAKRKAEAQAKRDRKAAKRRRERRYD